MDFNRLGRSCGESRASPGETNGLSLSKPVAKFLPNMPILRTDTCSITFRVAGWPGAFSDHLSDANSYAGTGNVLDITKADSTVFSNP